MTTPASPPDTATDRGQRVADSLDRISLVQALQDVEVANSRAIDLTQRLVTAHDEIRTLRSRVAELEHQMGAGGPLAAARRRLAGPAKAVARAVLPLSVRTRLRAQLR